MPFTTLLLLLLAIPAGAMGLIFGGLNGLRLVAALAMLFALVAATAVIDVAREQSARATFADAAGVLSFFMGAFLLAGKARWGMLCVCAGLACAHALRKLVTMLQLRYRTHRSARRALRERRTTDRGLFSDKPDD